MKRTKKEIMNGIESVSSKIVAPNTVKYFQSDGTCIIRLHLTDIMTFNPENKRLTLNSDGWQTVTTRERINRFLPVGWRLTQEKSIWYLNYQPENKRYTYQDGITICFDNSVTGDKKDAKSALKLKKEINVYVKNYIKALFNGDVAQPGPGDCFYCLMIDTETGEPLKNTDHLLSHIDENYFVPSLLNNAIKQLPVSKPANTVLGYLWNYHRQKMDFFYDHAKDQLQKSLKRYMYRQLGFAA